MDYENKKKKKIYGNLNFIGLLIKSKMINKQIAFYVLENTLKNSVADDHVSKIKKLNTYEGACKFLLQVGSLIDMKNKNLDKDRDRENQAKFETIFQTLMDVSNN